jgi:hypothetical protein
MATKVLTAHVPLPLAEKNDQMATRRRRSIPNLSKLNINDVVSNF